MRRLRKRLLRDLETVGRNLEGRADLPPSRRLMGQEALGLIAEDLAGMERGAKVCERRIMEAEKVPVAEKIISLSHSDASFIVKGGWNTVVGYRPQLARSGSGFGTALVVPRGNAADSRHLVRMVKEQITNTGVIPAMAVPEPIRLQQSRGARGSGGPWDQSDQHERSLTKARTSSRPSNGRAGLTDRCGPSVARPSHWPSL